MSYDRILGSGKIPQFSSPDVNSTPLSILSASVPNLRSQNLPPIHTGQGVAQAEVTLSVCARQNRLIVLNHLRYETSSLSAYQLNVATISTSFFTLLPANLKNSPLHNMAFYSYQAIEDRISEAIDSIHDGWYTNCSAAAKEYDVPLRRLQRRWNGCDSKSTRTGTNKALTEAQEEAIREYIGRLDDINMSARRRMIVGAANYLIRFENRQVDHQWLTPFLKRNPDFYVRKQKPLAADRKNSHNVNDMASYFGKLERVMKEKGITEVDVWNMDETGFRIGCGRAQLVVTLDSDKPLRMTDPDNRDRYLARRKKGEVVTRTILKPKPTLFFLSSIMINVAAPHPKSPPPPSPFRTTINVTISFSLTVSEYFCRSRPFIQTHLGSTIIRIVVGPFPSYYQRRRCIIPFDRTNRALPLPRGLTFDLDDEKRHWRT